VATEKTTEENEMKNNRSAIAVLLLLVVGLTGIAAPVTAADVGINSRITPVFEFTVNATTINFPLTTVGQNDLTSPNLVTVNTNSPYEIKVKGFSSVFPGLPANKEGFLKALISGTGYSGVSLTNALQVSVNSNYVSLSGTDQVAHTSATGGAYSSPIKLRQVTTFADPVLASGDMYIATVVITGAATA
jgi:hypothetical protein